MKTVMKVVIDNKACNGLKGEWGLSIVVEYKGKKILVDAGASDLFIENMQKMDIDIQDIDYIDEKNGKTILYQQARITEAMGLSIDNDDENFAQIEVNGSKGYAATEDAVSFIVWSDGISLYTISGNISLDALFAFAESIR